eukprot:1139069-Pelagomonas_calceolata.AAC.5
MLLNSSSALVQGLQGLQGVGLQPENLADRLLEKKRKQHVGSENNSYMRYGKGDTLAQRAVSPPSPEGNLPLEEGTSY